MSNLYDALACKKGATWKESQIDKDRSYLARNPDILKNTNDLAGNSRVHGDVSNETQKKIIDKIIEIGTRYSLSFRDIAHMLLIAKVESGFNPDAAAGSTSAAGLAQCTDGFAKELLKPQISKKILGFTLDITLAKDRFDAEKGAYALLIAFIKCKSLACTLAGDDYEKFVYTYHHDGWNSKKNKSEKENTDAYKIAQNKIVSKIDEIEKNLKQTKSTQFNIKDNNNTPKANQPYIAITPKSKEKDKPSSAQKAGEVEIIHGTTDSNGNTKPIKTFGAAEIVFIILNKPIWDTIRKSAVATTDKKYKVKRGDSLSKIAKENGTTAEAIAKSNNIKNQNNIQEGQELIIETTYTPKKPDNQLITYALEKLNIPTDAINTLCEYAKSHIILPKGSESQKNNSISIKETPKKTVTKKEIPTAKTTKSNNQGNVAVSATNTDPAIIFAKDITRKDLISDHTINLLKKIGKDIGLEKIIITSGIRPPKKQAQTMYSNIEAKGIASQKNMYSHAGDMIIDVYAQKKSQGLSKDEIIKAMTDKIIDLSDNGTRVSKHCVSEKQYNKLNVIDVSCKQMRASARMPFESAVEKMVKSGEIKKFINPRSVSGEPAYHLEIPQP